MNGLDPMIRQTGGTKMKHSRLSTIALATATLLASALTMSADSSAQTRIRFECRADGAVDISMASRYEIRGARRKFTTEFEAGPGTGFLAGNRLGVQVKGVRVGVMTLEAIIGGDVVGDLNFDTRPQPPDSIAFPANWPANVGRGTVVNVLRGTTRVLGCTLR
jgi:hypothetical protein